jgi:hypothetical protein
LTSYQSLLSLQALCNPTRNPIHGEGASAHNVGAFRREFDITEAFFFVVKVLATHRSDDRIEITTLRP